ADLSNFVDVVSREGQMRRSLIWIAMALVAGGWYFRSNLPLDKILPRRREEQAIPTALPPPPANRDVIRIASFSIRGFGQQKASNLDVMKILVDIVRRFDLVAIQEIRSTDQQLIPDFVDQINADGHQYDFVLGQRQGRTLSQEQYAFIFDAASLQVDRQACYSIEDPEDLLHRPPLVAPFRVRGVPPERAFTFVLINIHTDPDEVDTEIDVLADVYRAVRRASLGEDDVILLGDLNADDRHLGELAHVPAIRWVISAAPTNTRGTRQYDNILFSGRSTTEFTGRAGIVRLDREYGLTVEEALRVSDHLPIWAEFNVYEHGARGPIAVLPERTATE
ncbi:MAG: endonuclease/exonuclease/phosphatase family protein, partial [Pirellulales bacterium]